jgi:hypothetical protein
MDRDLGRDVVVDRHPRALVAPQVADGVLRAALVAVDHAHVAAERQAEEDGEDVAESMESSGSTLW